MATEQVAVQFRQFICLGLTYGFVWATSISPRSKKHIRTQSGYSFLRGITSLVATTVIVPEQAEGEMRCPLLHLHYACTTVQQVVHYTNHGVRCRPERDWQTKRR